MTEINELAEITLPITFTSTNYKIVVTDRINGGGEYEGYTIQQRFVSYFTAHGFTITGTTITSIADSFDYIAIGY